MLDFSFTIITVGYFEYRSTFVKNYCSVSFSVIMAPPKSIWISSFGSIHFGKGYHLLCGITGFNLLLISVQALHSLALANLSRWIYCHQMFCARDKLAKLPGCVEWMSSSTESVIALGIPIPSSMHSSICLTLRSRQYE